MADGYMSNICSKHEVCMYLHYTTLHNEGRLGYFLTILCVPSTCNQCLKIATRGVLQN